MLGANSTINEMGIEKLNERLQYVKEQNLIHICKQIKLGSLFQLVLSTANRRK
jgi:hypothetical protein